MAHITASAPARHLYVHVPFCRRRCSYCDFAIAVRRRIPAHDFVAATRTELRMARDNGALAAPLATLYLGGGTPSLLPPAALETLLADILDPTPAAAVEVTLEANPEDVTPAAARAWLEAGVNRVSLGAQTFDEGALRWMHRSHGAAGITAAVAALRNAGIANISLDLIFALPPELRRDWGRDLDRTIALQPAHVSLYGLTVEPRTPLARWISRGATGEPDDDRYAAEYLEAQARLADAGYARYEVSNTCRDGMHARHNSAYWSGAAYLGVGPAAHSFDGRTRRWNLPTWTAYRAALSDGRPPLASTETLTPAQHALERRYLLLRTSAGLPLAEVPAALASAWAEQGWVTLSGGRMICTPEGWLRLDALVSRLSGTSDP